MKVYGETIFDILYLLIAIVSGIVILARSKNSLEKFMGTAVLILGCGDAFHLVPRVLDYFVDKDLTAALGIGKLVTSITMTVFYIFMYNIYQINYHENENKALEGTVWALAIIRVLLCFLPQNRWITNDGSLMIGIVRNVPFVILGLIVIFLYFSKRNEDKVFKNIWLYVLLSFLFYLPVVIGASEIPMLGMFMLPKTICYIFIIFAFRRKIKENV